MAPARGGKIRACTEHPPFPKRGRRYLKLREGGIAKKKRTVYKRPAH